MVNGLTDARVRSLYVKHDSQCMTNCKTCAKPDATICPECTDNPFCSEHAVKCSNCNRDCCNECIVPCDVCHRQLCGNVDHNCNAMTCRVCGDVSACNHCGLECTHGAWMCQQCDNKHDDNNCTAYDPDGFF